MNPFKYGTVVGGSYFINRKKEISQIKNDLISGNNIILYAPRRYGKTSLIMEILKKLKKEKVKTVYIDLSRYYREDTREVRIQRSFFPHVFKITHLCVTHRCVMSTCGGL